MQADFPALRQCPLFQGIDPANLPGLLDCLGARVARYHRHQLIFAEGDAADYVGIVLSGAAQVVQEDFYGNRSILTHTGPGELFGESYACASVAALPVSVVAVEDSQVMILNCRHITTTCSSACSYHTQMIYNLLRVVANDNLVFHQKIEITSRRSTREKLMAYLLCLAMQHGSDSFTIPYDRQGLADYLGVDRSALSVEISKLRRDGVIECSRSRFRLLQ